MYGPETVTFLKPIHYKIAILYFKKQMENTMGLEPSHARQLSLYKPLG
jgi:hypothetical protein